jgi:macrolide-specific efflux system membrane fusion protein
MKTLACALSGLMLLVCGAPARGADDVQVSSVLVKLIEQVEVPAREAGVLEELLVREGQMVKAGAPLARIEDGAAQLDKRRAELELAAAGKEAANDVKVRFARKSLEVAESELRRATDSEKRFAQSVSQSEMDQMKLQVQKSSLEIEQAQLELELNQTARDLKANEVSLAEHAISQRKVNAPLAGFVAEISRHRGEWVQPGQSILRILRLDRLRAEGLVPAESVSGDATGRKVTLQLKSGQSAPVEYTGEVVFVSPEIDPVNGQVRVWADIDNRDLKLRPGMHGSLTIHATQAK